MVSPRLLSLLGARRCWTSVVLTVSEYLLESRLSRSFSLGRKALTSAFHSEGTTGHVDHGLLQNTCSLSLFSLSFSLSSSRLVILPPRSLPSIFLLLFLLSSFVISLGHRYTRGLYTRDVNALAYTEFCIKLKNAVRLLLCTLFSFIYVYVYVLHILCAAKIISR